jgi:hypothetical protein
MNKVAIPNMQHNNPTIKERIIAKTPHPTPKIPSYSKLALSIDVIFCEFILRIKEDRRI